MQNFPTVGLFDGNFRANLEATGMGYDKEVAMIRLAHEMDLLTTPYAFTPDEASGDGEGRLRYPGGARRADHRRQHRRAGVALTLEQAMDRVMAMAEAGRKVRSDLSASATAARSTSRSRWGRR